MTRHLTSARSIVEDCDALLVRFQSLSDHDFQQPLLQDRIHQILAYRRRKAPPDTCVGISQTANRVLKSATRSVALAVRHEIESGRLFDSLQIVVRERPGLSALSTFLCHGKRRSTELRILALLITHSLESELETGQQVKQVLGHWAHLLDRRASEVTEIEAIGRFCLDVLGVINDDNAVVDPVALGILALPPQFKSLRSLTTHGQKFVSACRRLCGCIDRAMQLAPAVYIGIHRAAAALCLPIPKSSTLGRVLTAHERLNPILRRELLRSCSVMNPQPAPSYIVLPYSCPIFDLVADCNFMEVQRMISAGEAPINAIDPFGLGLFYHAAYYGWRHKGAVSALPMCRCLVDLGVDLFWGDEIGNGPLDTLLDSIIVSRARNEVCAMLGLAELESIAQWFGRDWNQCREDYLAKRSFNVLHESLLGLSDGVQLEDALQRAQRDGILGEVLEAGDAQGRTVLTWAVEYHDVESTTLLVRYGADVNYCRRTRDTHLPLLHLALAGKDVPQDLLTCLLDAGADANAQDNEGWTAAHIAASWQDQRSLNTMITSSKVPLDLQARTLEGQSVEDLVNQLT